MKRVAIWKVVVILAVISGIAGVAGYSQEDIQIVQDSAFGARMRPAAVFPHDAHNEKAGVDDCTICHHMYQDGVKADGESSEGMECSECHQLNNQNNPIPLAVVYHNRCKGCHAESKQGPVVCGECHVR